MTDKYITMAHGAGGKQTNDLIGSIFSKYFKNPFLTEDDASVLPTPKGKIAMSTDGFIVSYVFCVFGTILFFT